MNEERDELKDSVAIVGIGCRFPGNIGNTDTFWEYLCESKSAITEVPLSRWNAEYFFDSRKGVSGKTTCKYGGFLENIEFFDANHFNISAIEAKAMDPQQRLLLQVAWEAIENSGIATHSLAGSQTGVFIGIGNSDYDRASCKTIEELNMFTGPGTSYSSSASRISYFFDLKGPSIALDTGCSSSLVALHQACSSLKSKEINNALVGGVNVILSPEKTIMLSQAGILSSSGQCSSFQANADGYIRSEGCGIVVLKRLSDAVRDKDQIRAIIRGSAVNHNGLSNGFSSPNGIAQSKVISEALVNAQCEPSSIGYIEAHATGTLLGDAIEFKALKNSLFEGRLEGQRCAITTLKPNLGHMEPASGIASLIKAVMCLEKKEIPPHRVSDEYNSHLNLDEDDIFFIPNELTSWEESRKRRAGVSAFSFSGTNSHVILEEFIAEDSKYCKGNDDSEEEYIIFITGENEKQIVDQAQCYAKYIDTIDQKKLHNLCFTINTSVNFSGDFRKISRGYDIDSLRENLLSISVDANEKLGDLSKLSIVLDSHSLVKNHDFSLLYRDSLEVKKTYEECKKRVEKLKLEVSENELREFSSGLGLIRAWLDWGIQPDSIAVNQIGIDSFVAACAIGDISLNDALKSAFGDKNFDFGTRVSNLNKIELEFTSNNNKFDFIINLGGSTKGVFCLDGAEKNDWIETACTLFLEGYYFNWGAFKEKFEYRRVPLPTWDFQNKPYWINEKTVSIDTESKIKFDSKNNDIEEILVWLRAYAETRINSKLIDERRTIPPYIVLDLGNKGLLGMQVPKKYGGLGLNTSESMKIMTQMGAIDTTLASFLGVNNFLGIRPIINFSVEDKKLELLPLLAKGRILASFAFTEPGAGSNPRAIDTTANFNGHEYSITGEKIYIGSASWASVINVFARQVDEDKQPVGISAFIVDQGSTGMSHGPEVLTMGIRGMPQNSIFFRDTSVTLENLLGEHGKGMEVAEDAMNYARLAIAATSIGGMKRALQIMERYASRRNISTGLLLENPITKSRLQESLSMVTSTESLVMVVSELIDRGVELPSEVYAICKASGPEFFWIVADRLVQLLGGRGYIETNIAPRLLRDARIGRIFEGPTETMHMFIGSRISKYPSKIYEVFVTYFDGSSIWEDLQKKINTLEEAMNSSSTFFDTEIANKNWSYSIIGELAVFSLLEASCLSQINEKNTNSNHREIASIWCASQSNYILNKALIQLSNCEKTMNSLELQKQISNYEVDIGNVEQQLAGEEQVLDALIVKNIINRDMVSPTFAATTTSKGPISSNITTRDWLINWVANKLNIPISGIKGDQAFTTFGLDSNDAVQLALDLGEFLNVELEATIIWNFPTIDALVENFTLQKKSSNHDHGKKLSTSLSIQESDKDLKEMLLMEIKDD